MWSPRYDERQWQQARELAKCTHSLFPDNSLRSAREEIGKSDNWLELKITGCTYRQIMPPPSTSNRYYILLSFRSRSPPHHRFKTPLLDIPFCFAHRSGHLLSRVFGCICNRRLCRRFNSAPRWPCQGIAEKNCQSYDYPEDEHGNGNAAGNGL